MNDTRPIAGRVKRSLVFLAATVATAAAAQLVAWSSRSVDGEAARSAAVSPAFAALSPNSWHEIEPRSAGWSVFRTDHGGAVYDPDRNSVFLFGSDTHLHDFDNTVREFRLDEGRWYSPYARSPRYTMQTDGAGVRVAGLRGDKPWPMHVYDSMVYDRSHRRIVVMSGAKHNFVPAPGVQRDPVWAYSPGQNRWSMLSVEAVPNFFAAGAVYDPTRDVIVGYGSLVDGGPFVSLRGERTVERTGVWELGPDRSEWRLVSAELHHWGWFNAEFDVANRAMIVFGGDPDDPSLWVYVVGATVGAPGRWERRRPDGDVCPGGYYFPAAYDSKRHVTLYLPFDRGAGQTVTCVYDAARNVARRLRGAELPGVGLNYTMVYVERQDVFLLVTGSFSRNVATRVWVMRPNLRLLDG